MVYLAKSIRFGGTELTNHLISVSNLAEYIARDICKLDEEQVKMVRQSAYLHDIGKVTNNFQSWVGGRDKSIEEDKTWVDIEEEEPTSDGKKRLFLKHNEVSWAYLKRLTALSESVLESILYHHPISIRNGNCFDMYDSLSVDDLMAIEEYVTYLDNRFNLEIKFNDCEDLGEIPPLYSSREGLDSVFMSKCSLSYIIRSILIASDRIASNLHNGDLEKLILNDKEYLAELTTKIHKLEEIKDIDLYCIGEYDASRLKMQEELLDQIDNHTTIIGATAGFGKTLMGLKWIMKGGKKGLWVCPRNIIARGVYESLVKELETIGLNSQSVGLLLSGKYIHGNEDSDIIVTNIDNFLNPILKNRISHSLTRMITSNVVFDEFHELVSKLPIFSAWVKVMWARHNVLKVNTLMLSATPIMIKDENGFGSLISRVFWDTAKHKTKVLYAPSHIGTSEFKVNVLRYDIVDDVQLEETSDVCVLLNSVGSAQKGYISNPKAQDLLHARYGEDDLEIKRSNLIKYHGNKKDLSNRYSVIGTRLIGTGLDISFTNLFESVVSPEQTLQAIGRTNRWGEVKNTIPNLKLFLVDQSAGERAIASQIYDWSITKKWHEHMKLYDDKVVTLNDLYEIYHNFNTNNYNALKTHLMTCYRESVRDCKKLQPYKSMAIKSAKKTAYSNSNSYRGDSDNYLVMARLDDKDELCNIICVDEFVLRDEIGDSKERQKLYVKHIINNKKYSLNEYNLTKSNKKYLLTLNELMENGIGKEEDKPLVLVLYRYSKELGLYNPDKFLQD